MKLESSHTAPSSAPIGRIDVHHHVIPPAFREAMAGRDIAGDPVPKWTPEDSIVVMDMNRIATGILSLSVPGVHLGGGEGQAKTLARRCNEYNAEVVEKYPGRFGSFATLPMPFTDSACAEAIYALDVLKADGIVLLGSTDGYFLGDRRFDDLMAELHRRKAVVFLHPNLHESSRQLGLDAPPYLIEFLCDTTRAAVNMIFSGTIAKYPDIRFILAHAGGFLPYAAWRLSLANALPKYSDMEPNGILRAIRNFYFDTALSPSPTTMAALKELIDPSHLLFGSDFPFAPAPIIGLETRQLDQGTVFSSEQKAAIDRGNALPLFPRLAKQSEIVAPILPWRRTGLREAFRRMAHRRLVSLAERMRNQ